MATKSYGRFWVVSLLVVLDEFEAVPVLPIKHVAALVLFLHPLATIMEAAIRVGVLRAVRLHFWDLLLNFFQNRFLVKLLLARVWSFFFEWLWGGSASQEAELFLIVEPWASFTGVWLTETIEWWLFIWGSGQGNIVLLSHVKVQWNAWSSLF